MEKTPPKRKISPFLIAVIILLFLALALCAGVFWLWYSGRNAMTQADTTPELPTQDTTEPLSGLDPYAGNNNYVQYNGAYYEYNEDITNILLLGIDSKARSDAEPAQPTQADVVVLAVLDRRQNKMSLVSLSRDIMCDIELLNSHGEIISQTNAQLALSYAYGDGAHISCETTRNAVSNLFYGLPIHGYGAYQLTGIEKLNDSVGGVTLTIMAGDIDFPSISKWTSRLVDGETITMKGHEARYYIGSRSQNSPNANEMRMQRQKQYMLALLSQAKEQILSDPTALLTLYDAVDEYIITDLSLSDISYLATTALSMDFSSNIHTLKGEAILNKETNYAEMYVDQEALSALMMELFYTKVS